MTIEDKVAMGLIEMSGRHRAALAYAMSEEGIYIDRQTLLAILTGEAQNKEKRGERNGNQSN